MDGDVVKNPITWWFRRLIDIAEGCDDGRAIAAGLLMLLSVLALTFVITGVIALAFLVHPGVLVALGLLGLACVVRWVLGGER